MGRSSGIPGVKTGDGEETAVVLAPVPVWPAESLPQQAAPPVVNAQEVEPPAAILVTLEIPVTVTWKVELLVLELPSCPEDPKPQQKTLPSLLRAHV